jgi:methionine-rich copper-binding protein CopC
MLLLVEGSRAAERGREMRGTIPPMKGRLAAAVLMALAVPVLTAAARLPHLELARTLPANGATVDSVPEIRLWFKEPPMEMGAKSVTLRILSSEGKVIATGNAARDPKDRKIYGIKLQRGLPRGSYTVGWQAMAPDGDAVRGEFAFTVTSP